MPNGVNLKKRLALFSVTENIRDNLTSVVQHESP